MPLEIQLTDLKIKEIIKGEAPKTITLNQALDYVEKNTKYLMFLNKGIDGYYYELTSTSIVEEDHEIFNSMIKEFEGEYNKSEFKDKIQTYVK